MKVVKLGNGRMAVQSKRAEALLEKLIEEDKLWSYLSVVFNNSVENQSTKVEPPSARDEKTMLEMKSMLEEVYKKVNSMQVSVQPRVIENVAQIESAATTTEVKQNRPRKAKPKKKAPPKMGGIDLGAMASKFNKSDRR